MTLRPRSHDAGRTIVAVPRGLGRTKTGLQAERADWEDPDQLRRISNGSAQRLVPCPVCQQPKGSFCVSSNGKRIASCGHPARLRLGRRFIQQHIDKVESR